MLFVEINLYYVVFRLSFPLPIFLCFNFRITHSRSSEGKSRWNKVRKVKKKKLRKLSVLTWLKILKKIFSVIHEIYARGLLHNALHMQNIIILDKNHPIVTDLCQACLISDPIIYKIKVGFIKQAKYNKIHKPLASELRNIPGRYARLYNE